MIGVVAIDPGTTESAYIALDAAGAVIGFGKLDNAAMLRRLVELEHGGGDVVLEMVASYGMAVGAEVFETCVWIGRFIQVATRPVHRMTRAQVKMTLCHHTKGVNDAVLRQRVIDLYGGKAAAIGCKSAPGPLYGIKADVWQALALALAWKSQTISTR